VKKGKKAWLTVALAALVAALDTATGAQLLPALAEPLVQAVVEAVAPVKSGL